MKWIKVSERLPEINTKNLIYDSFNDEIRLAQYQYDWKVCSECGDILPRYDITHWAELTEPPKDTE